MASETAGSDVGGKAPGTWPLTPLMMLGLMGETWSLPLGAPSLMEETWSLPLGAPSLVEETRSLPLGAPSLMGRHGPQHLEAPSLMEEILFLTSGSSQSDWELWSPTSGNS